ncbi:MAG: hypothetical protein CMF42_00340 [Legionellales bacterium]|nr:hypothetical protein [Legionellales bacterium]|tara:strand:+ start:1499 stop:2077 length:579 start_codon:yes stop_codon:yes gene_type:complete
MLENINYSEYKQDIKRVIYDGQIILMNTRRDDSLKPAVVIDIDETILSNYQYILDHDSLDDLNHFCSWQSLGLCKPIEPVVDFYHWLINHNFNVFFVTARNYDLKVATYENLAKIGVTNWTGIYFRDEKKWPSTKLYKASQRREIFSNGYQILLNIGDQPTDFEGGFAEHHLQIPNPFYLESKLPWKKQPIH